MKILVQLLDNSLIKKIILFLNDWKIKHAWKKIMASHAKENFQ